MSREAMLKFGYITVDAFQTGATLTLPNEVLRWMLPDGDGEYYRWDGMLPKVVPAGATPGSTGGTGKGAWLSVGDTTLRSLLASHTAPGASMVALPRGTVRDAMYFLTPEMFMYSGLSVSGAVQACADYARLWG